MKSAEALVDCLISEGIDVVFGIPGSKFVDVLDAMWFKRDLVRFVTSRHEQGAALMAMGYALARRSTGVCYSTLGPGATNLVTGVACAYKNAVPIVALSGMMSSELLGRDGWQEIDQVSILRPVTKESRVVPHAESIPLFLRRAFRTATSYLPGPVHLSIPMEQLTEEIPYERLNPERYRSTSQPEIRVGSHLLNQVLQLLNTARSPVILAGREVKWDQADSEVLNLAEKLNLPVVTTLDGHGGVPTNHPLVLGPAYKASSWSMANDCLRNADAVLALGVKFDILGTGFDYSLLPGHAALIHVSRFSEFVGANFPVTVGLIASLKDFAKDLLTEAAPFPLPERETKTWLEKLAVWRETRGDDVEKLKQAKPIKPQWLAAALSDYAAPGSYMFLDGGNFRKFLMHHMELPRGDLIFIDHGYGCVGTAFPMALGYKVAKPESRVFCVTGDMGYLINGGELETAVRENLPVITVIFNDCGLGNVREYQVRRFGGRYIGVDYAPVDYAAAARAFGAHGERVEDPAEIEPAFKRALKSRLPAVVDVLVDKTELARK